MVDISIFDSYYNLDDFTIRYIQHEIKSSPVEELLDRLLVNLDCTIIDKGIRLMQTIGNVYSHLITEYIYLVNNYVSNESDKDVWFTKLITRHNLNIEYEKENPPVWYDGEKAKKRYEKKIKSAITNRPKKEKKAKGPSKAELKLAARVSKMNKLNFKINGANLSS